MSVDITPFEIGRMFFHYTRSLRRTASQMVSRYALASELLAKAWRGETAKSDVAALVVQDLLGGEIMFKNVVGVGEHFWNAVPNGPDSYHFNVCADALPASEPATTGSAKRELMLARPGVSERYALLKRRLAEAMRSET